MKNDTSFYEERYVVWGMLGETRKTNEKKGEKKWQLTSHSMHSLVATSRIVAKISFVPLV